MRIEWNERLVRLGSKEYPYHFGYDCVERIIYALRQYDTDRFIVVTDDTVLELHGDALLPELGRHAPVEVLSLPAGEGMKSMSTLTAHLERAIAAGATRRSVIIAFGGGVPGNLAGTLAGLLYRGVRLIHIPTTTVAAMDSVISLKQAVNSSHGKNHIGTYRAPEAVYTDVRFFETLPKRELRSGMCEATKNCIAISPDSIPTLRGALSQGDLSSPSTLLWVLEESLAAKSKVTALDAYEQNSGLILEYGHTVGHAVELCDQHARGAEGISHGEAIAFGMAVAARISARLGEMDDAVVDIHDELILSNGAPLHTPEGISLSDILEVLRADNKRGYLKLGPDEGAFVLLRDIGLPLGPADRPLVAVPYELVEDVLVDLTYPTTELVGEGRDSR